MKIIEGRIVKPVPLEELNTGAVFLFNHEYYIKAVGCVGTSNHTSIVALETGHGLDVPLDTQVIPVEAELHIK
ncbi:hypothetical protein NVP1084O_003 [Vibrio phage 1.084.O._10N.261.49.F5]|nr:hypothetical protein NVP1084O_003 [Vibrio phage 1.084.O._10N.261.49.F5]